MIDNCKFGHLTMINNQYNSLLIVHRKKVMNNSYFLLNGTYNKYSLKTANASRSF